MRKLILLLMSTLALGVSARSKHVYLPQTGPVPLRFEALPGPQTTNFVLPPLDRGKFPAVEQVSTNKSATNVVAATNSATSANVAKTPAATTNVSLTQTAADASTNQSQPVMPALSTPATNASAGVPSREDVLSAQRLVQFFRLGSATNSSDPVLAVPLQFTPPPAPVSPPSSSATYRSE